MRQLQMNIGTVGKTIVRQGFQLIVRVEVLRSLCANSGSALRLYASRLLRIARGAAWHEPSMVGMKHASVMAWWPDSGRYGRGRTAPAATRDFVSPYGRSHAERLKQVNGTNTTCLAKLAALQNGLPGKTGCPVKRVPNSEQKAVGSLPALS